MAAQMHTQEDFKVLAETKARELQEIQEMRIEMLEKALESKEILFAKEAKEKQQLIRDFQYNLKLIRQRDVEIDELTQLSKTLTDQLNQKDRVISDLRIMVDKQKEKISTTDHLLEEEAKRWQKKLKDERQQVQAYCKAKEDGIERDRQEQELLKRRYHQRLIELETDLEAQKTHMLAEFDSLLRQREHEYRDRMDELAAVTEGREQRVKSLSRECSGLKGEVDSLRSDLKEQCEEKRTLEQKLQTDQWTYQEERTVYESNIAEMEVKLKHTEEKLRLLQKEMDAKVSKLDGLCRQKELSLMTAVQAHRDEVHRLETESRSLQNKWNEQRSELEEHQREMQKRSDGLVQELEMMKTQVVEQNDTHSTEISQLLSKCEVSERKIQTLEKQCDISRMDSLEKSKEVSRYKGELGKALEQCAKLDREKAQLSLEHQQEREEVEIRVCHQNESLIVELTGARDRALAEVERLKRCLQEAQTTFEDFKNEKNKKTNEVASLQALQQQNEQLKVVIASMKREMEDISQASHHSNPVTDGPITKGYVLYLEQEVQRLKRECRQMAENQERRQPLGLHQPSQALRDRVMNVLKQEGSQTSKEDAYLVALNHKIKSMEASVQRNTPEVSKLKLKLLRASVVIAELVKEKNKLSNIIRIILPHLNLTVHQDTTQLHGVPMGGPQQHGIPPEHDQHLKFPLKNPQHHGIPLETNQQSHTTVNAHSSAAKPPPSPLASPLLVPDQNASHKTIQHTVLLHEEELLNQPSQDGYEGPQQEHQEAELHQLDGQRTQFDMQQHRRGQRQQQQQFMQQELLEPKQYPQQHQQTQVQSPHQQPRVQPPHQQPQVLLPHQQPQVQPPHQQPQVQPPHQQPQVQQHLQEYHRKQLQDMHKLSSSSTTSGTDSGGTPRSDGIPHSELDLSVTLSSFHLEDSFGLNTAKSDFQAVMSNLDMAGQDSDTP